MLLMKGSVHDIQWSPDSTKMAFTVYLGTGSSNDVPRIYITTADGLNQKQLTHSGSMYPAWSPDGKKIAFMSTEKGNGGIWVMNLDDSNLIQLTN
jgi:TolB protein